MNRDFDVDSRDRVIRGTVVAKLVEDFKRVLHRSGAAARRAHMAPATLRVWERRYGVVNPQRSASQQRLYSEEDILRLKRLKSLVDRGYAIGTIARLSLQQLEGLVFSAGLRSPSELTAGQRWVLVGNSLAGRITRWGVGLNRPQTYPDLAAALAQVTAGFADIAVIHAPTLREEVAEQLIALQNKSPATRLVVIYAFGMLAATRVLAARGLHLIREPVTRMQFEDLALAWCANSPPAAPKIAERPDRAKRIFSDAQLEQIEQRAGVIRCECPNHLAGLIQQASAFEAFSDECRSVNAEDAALHRFLGDVANQACALFELALQRVLTAEGLPGDSAGM